MYKDLDELTLDKAILMVKNQFTLDLAKIQVNLRAENAKGKDKNDAQLKIWRDQQMFLIKQIEASEQELDMIRKMKQKGRIES